MHLHVHLPMILHLKFAFSSLIRVSYFIVDEAGFVAVKKTWLPVVVSSVRFVLYRLDQKTRSSRDLPPEHSTKQDIVI